MNPSQEDIERAIYLDFESEGRKPDGEESPPAVGGTLIDGVHAATLLHPDLENAAEEQSLEHSTLADYLKSIHGRSIAENRRIVFFSSAESKLFEDHGLDISDSVLDLRPMARDSGLYDAVWKAYKENDRRFRDPDTAQSTRDALRTKSFGLLTLIAADLGLPRPQGYGAGKTGARIRYALKQAGKKSHYQYWSPGGKTKLTQVINHNEHDCRATRHVLEHLVANS